MSRTSSVQGHSPHALPDPYLSTTCDPDEISFQASAIRLTPTFESPHSNGPGSPQDARIDPTVQATYLEPNENNLSACTSPLSDSVCIEPREIELSSSSSWRDDSFSSYKSGASAPEPAFSSPMAPSAFQSTGIYYSPTIPAAGMAAGPNGVPTVAQPGLGVFNVEPPRLAPSVNHESIENDSGANRGRSPVFKITTFTRGDSPQSGASHTRRPSQSHLCAEPDELEDEEGDDPQSISATGKRSNDGTWLPDPSTNLAGIDPRSRGNEYVPSPNDVHIHRERDERNEDITHWSVSVSEANSVAGGDTPSPPRPRAHSHIPRRLRARSTGDRPLEREDYFSIKTRTADPSFLGPGVLVHESSDELSEDEESIGTYSNETSAEVEDPGRYDRSTPEVYSSLSPTKTDENIRLYPWHDAPRDSTPRSHAMQPDSSTDAMIAFEKRVRDLETASLAATVDNNSIFRVTSSFEKFAIGNTEPPKKRTSLFKPFLQASSMLKRQASDMSLSQSSTYPPLQRDSMDSQHRPSHAPRNPFNRRHSRSPSLSNALMAMTSQIASVGGSQPVQAVSPAPSPNPERTSLNLPQFTGRGRSRSEIPRPSSPGLINLMTAHGGPPVPNITSPRVSSEADQTPRSSHLGPETGPAEDGHDVDMGNNKGIVMEFPAIQTLPVPTLEGFKSQIMQLYPNLDAALIHRLAHEQDRRYKVLVGLQQKHSQAVANRSCKSTTFCFAQGGKETPLEDSKAPTETEAGQFQFRVTNFADGHEHDTGYAIGEGTVAAAQFPPGVPLPPVSRLPARFECPICFQVKTFKKPSDWSKHVQEDVQPFTCTFPHCNEPKSFKRKADWVRHENEKHRHLEWWTCAFHECNHTCYRKDNFVQHLVREHKMPEPRGKKGTNEVPNNRREQDVERLWQMVEECRHETEQPPQSQPCRFCGNVCSEWRKLSVHLGKHLEQLAMPVLRLSKPSSGPTPANPGRSAPLASYETSLQPQYAQNTFDFPSTVISGAEFSTEPESMTESLDYPYLGVDPHLTQAYPLHQNSTYPPPYSAPRSPNPDAIAVQSYPVPQVQVYPAEYYQPVQTHSPYTATYSSG